MGLCSNASIDIYLDELSSEEENPIFERIIKSAINSEDILISMQNEMDNILLEVVNDED